MKRQTVLFQRVNVLAVLLPPVLCLCSCKAPPETRRTQARRAAHVKRMDKLEVRRQQTLTVIRGSPLSSLVVKMDENAEKGREPFNSPAYREVTKNRTEQGPALLEEIGKQKTASYISLLALRRINPKGYQSLDQNLKLNALLKEFGRSKSYNRWGLPHLYWEEAAKALIELGRAAEPGLKRYLDDRSPAPVWGSEEFLEYTAYKYRRCDYALALLMEIRGVSVKELPRSPAERDVLIEKMK